MEVIPEESYEDLQEEQYEKDELPDPLEEQYEFEEKYTSKKKKYSKKNILHKAKGLYDEYVKRSLGPLAVIGGIITLFTTQAGKAVQNVAANTLQGVEKLSEALPAVAQSVGSFFSTLGPYFFYILIAIVAFGILDAIKPFI